MNDELYHQSPTIEYVIDYPRTMHETRTVLDAALASFHPVYLRHVPRASVFVTPEREESLLEVLASVRGITYRRGVPRKALDDRTEEP